MLVGARSGTYRSVAFLPPAHPYQDDAQPSAAGKPIDAAPRTGFRSISRPAWLRAVYVRGSSASPHILVPICRALRGPLGMCGVGAGLRSRTSACMDGMDARLGE